jgi:hypothetical protein
MLKSPFLFLSMASILFIAIGCATTNAELTAQDHRIQSLRESIRMERAHLDSFPEDTAAIRRIGHLIEEEEIAQKNRQEMVQPPLDAQDKIDAKNAEMRRQHEILRNKNP